MQLCPRFHAPAAPVAWPQALLSLVSDCYNEPLGDWPPDSPQGAKPGLSWVRAAEAIGWRAQFLVWRSVQGCWLWYLTLAQSYPEGSGLQLRGPRSPAENSMKSIYSVWLNQELCPVQHWPPETEQVSWARLLLLATDQSVKAAMLIRESILLLRFVWKVPISWN